MRLLIPLAALALLVPLVAFGATRQEEVRTLGAGAKFQDGPVTFTVTSGSGGNIQTGMVGFVSGSGSTLVIPCECKPGTYGPCHQVYVYDSAKKAYVGDNDQCAGGSATQHMVNYNDTSDSYMEGVVQSDGTVSLLTTGNATQ